MVILASRAVIEKNSEGFALWMGDDVVSTFPYEHPCFLSPLQETLHWQLLDHVTWPELLCNYFEKTKQEINMDSKKILSKLRTMQYHLLPLRSKLVLLETLCDRVC